MAVIKTDRIMSFEHLFRGAPFATTLTLYTKSDGKEDPKEYFFFKLNSKKAITLDKRITVHIQPDKPVILARMEKKTA